MITDCCHPPYIGPISTKVKTPLSDSEKERKAKYDDKSTVANACMAVTDLLNSQDMCSNQSINIYGPSTPRETVPMPSTSHQTAPPMLCPNNEFGANASAPPEFDASICVIDYYRSRMSAANPRYMEPSDTGSSQMIYSNACNTISTMYYQKPEKLSVTQSIQTKESDPNLD